MKRSTLIIGTVVLVALFGAAALFVWPMLSALSGQAGALAPVIIMILGCFAIGGVLMFLLFYSSRKGHDQRVYRGRDSAGDGT